MAAISRSLIKVLSPGGLPGAYSLKKVGRGLTLLALALLLCVGCRTPEVELQSAASHELDGAWHLVAAETIIPDGSRIPGESNESFLLFSDGHYSMNWASGPKSDYYAERFNPTDEEKLARYGSLLINAGRFEVDNNVLRIHPVFALVPEYVGGAGELDYSFDGETLELVWHMIESADGVPDPNTAVGVRFVSRWRRLPLQSDPR